MRRLIDKLFRRLALAILDRADERHLHPKRILLEEAQRQSAEYAREHMRGAMILDRREEILDLALARAPEDGVLLEFGVASGDSIRHLAGRTGRTIHGFDSFQGLPEDWPGRHEGKGHYSTDGRLPEVPPTVRLHKGTFDDTLPAFLAKETGTAALIHMDCDLYTSTKTVLDALADRIAPGTVILFDEYFNFVGWREHEFKAFHEFLVESGLGYRYLAWSYQQAAVIIEAKA